MYKKSLKTVLAIPLFAIVAILGLASCATPETRPIQDMSDAIAALRAAKEVQADILAPEIFREARESFFRGKREYRLKNFAKAKDLINRSRSLAERSELESLKNGGNRHAAPPDPMADQPPPVVEKPRPEDEPKKDNSVYYEAYSERKDEIEGRTKYPDAPALNGPVRYTPDVTPTNPSSQKPPLKPVDTTNPTEGT